MGAASLLSHAPCTHLLSLPKGQEEACEGGARVCCHLFCKCKKSFWLTRGRGDFVPAKEGTVFVCEGLRGTRACDQQVLVDILYLL